MGSLQGITEFLPISSSGHLTLFQFLFGFSNLDQFIIFDLVLHLGTLCSIVVVYRSQLVGLLGSDSVRLKQMILATLPLFPIVLILKPIENLFDRPEFLGPFFLMTAGILYGGIRFGYEKTLEEQKVNQWKDPFVIGLFQALAILPGISRSGSTISAARVVGWTRQEAVTFSFLLAIPAILGGIMVKSLQILTSETIALETASFSHYITGFVASFLFGYCALQVLISLASREKFMIFVWYCLTLGIVTSLYFIIN